MLRLAVQPPSRARPGVALYPPVAARLSSETSIYEELSQTWVVTTLIRHSGEVIYEQLGGKVADSAHPLPENSHGNGSSGNRSKDRAYFYFPDLTIHEPGRYRIRMSLMKMDYSCDTSPGGVVRVCEEVDSRSIVVEDVAPDHARLNAQERAFLRILRDDGQHVPSHPA